MQAAASTSGAANENLRAMIANGSRLGKGLFCVRDPSAWVAVTGAGRCGHRGRGTCPEAAASPRVVLRAPDPPPSTADWITRQVDPVTVLGLLCRRRPGGCSVSAGGAGAATHCWGGGGGGPAGRHPLGGAAPPPPPPASVVVQPWRRAQRQPAGGASARALGMVHLAAPAPSDCFPVHGMLNSAAQAAQHEACTTEHTDCNCKCRLMEIVSRAGCCCCCWADGQVQAAHMEWALTTAPTMALAASCLASIRSAM